MKKKISILFVHHGQGWGGAPNSLISMIDTIDKNSFDIKVLLLKDSIVSAKLKEAEIPYQVANSLFYKHIYQMFVNSEVHYIRWFEVFKLIKHVTIWILSRYYFSKSELSRHEFDILHLNSSVLTDFIHKSRSYKVILHLREPFRNKRFDLKSILLKKIISYSDLIIAISIDNANRLGLLKKTKVLYNRVKIVGHVIDHKSYNSMSVVYLGGYSKEKGFNLLVESLPFLDKKIKVYFAGYYPNYSSNIFNTFYHYFSYTRRKMFLNLVKMRNTNQVVEVGMVNDSFDLISKSCCLVSPFIVPHFSRPVLEAGLLKKTSIVCKLDGNNELIDNKQTGIILQKNTPFELAQEINSIALNPEYSRTLGFNSFYYFNQKFLPNSCDNIGSIYTSMITSH